MRYLRTLGSASATTSEIGYLLGFSEPSAFHRACNRWFRATPLEYRNGLVRECVSA